MKPWIRRTLIAIIGAGFLAGGLAACGHREPRGGMADVSAEDAAKWRGKLVERAGRELDLDAAQKARLGVLFDKLNAQRSALVADGADPKAQLEKLIAGDKFDRAGAAALIGEKTEAVRLKSPEVVAAAADFYDGLNAAQQAKVREFLARRGGRHHRG